MKQTRIDPGSEWQVLASTRRSQAASMVVKAGHSVGGPDNRHADSDQWMYVVSGSAAATVGGVPVSLEAGTLLLIEAGETHEIRNDGTEDLVTVNVYSPPEYDEG